MINTAIVTGGTGVTGTALVRYLLKQGVYVTALVRPGSLRKRYLPEDDKRLTIIDWGMENYKESSMLFKENKYDVFFHLAWDGSMGKQKEDNRNNMYLQHQNTLYMLDAVELCRKVNCKNFVVTGSQAEYGRCDGKISEQTRECPENGYGIAKLCAGQMTRIMCRNYGIRHIWARLFSVYGPYDGTHSLIDTSVKKLLKGESPEYTKGEQLWDYLYSFDAAKALFLLSEKGRDGEVYCVANGSPKILKNYIEIMHRVVNPNISPRLGVIPYGSSQVMSLVADINKLKEHVGFEPEYTFEMGIEEIKQWNEGELMI